MIDYLKMSDFDISKRVLIALGYKPAYEDESCISFLSSDGRKDVGYGGVKRFKFDPCNNPADAWPIIVENGISVILHDEYQGQPWFACKGRINATHANPLRAAMIVFFMMKDAENV
ncbi:MAG: phage protein NinX family protein [Sphingobacterium sp.]